MPKRVLVADDSALVRLTVARGVRGRGCEVVESDSVKAASAVDAATLACAVLDLDLGDGWGTDVAARLREAAPELPIAFFTSEKSGAVVERARAIGPVFAKPHDLERAIDWAVNRS